MTFDLPKGFQDKNPNILKKVKEDFKNPDKGFHYLFQGSVGCGKTYLAKLIAHNLIKSKIVEPKEYLVSARKTYSSFLETISSSYTDKGTAIAKLKRSIGSVEFVILDDLGDEKPNTEASHEYFSSILEDRYDYIGKYPFARTIITTNLKSQDFINAYGSRLFDRITDIFTIMKFKEHSFRQENKSVVEG
jgi:DNA replication protein DnaC